MKAISAIALACSTLFFTSCGEIQFPEEMPPGSKELSEVPTSCRGTFAAIEDGQEADDTFTITRTQLITEENEPLTIGEQFTLRQKGDWFYANFQDDNGWFYVLPFRPLGTDQIEYGIFQLGDEADEKDLSAIAPFTRNEDDFLSSYQVRMNSKQFEQLMGSSLLEMTRAKRK